MCLDANHMVIKEKAMTWFRKALVDAILVSLPAFRKTPHLASLASVYSTLLTILNLLIPSFPPILNGARTSVVSPD